MLNSGTFLFFLFVYFSILSCIMLFDLLLESYFHLSIVFLSIFPCIDFLLFFFFKRRKGMEIERERNVNVREKHRSVACFMCQTRAGLQPSMCPDLEWNRDLSLCRMTPTQLSHTGQGCVHFLFVALVITLYIHNLS